MRYLLSVILVIVHLGLYAQNVNKQNFPEKKNFNRVEMALPVVNGYTVLRCDFHTHTVFSDGLVWPEYRVREAWKQGLDVLAITDHIEYRPFKEYVGGDLNTSYELALPVAQELGIMLIRGTEVTRRQGVIGHFNALFIKDANAIDQADPEKALQAAYDQGAFIMYNHPGWAVDTCLLTEFQQAMIEKGLVRGIEVFNNDEFYPRALSWSRDQNLTVFSSSDIHWTINDVLETHVLEGVETHFRPMTLLFVEENTQEGVREALDNRRTLAYFYGNVAGEERWLKSLFLASVKLEKISEKGKSAFYKMTNFSGIQYTFTIGDAQYMLDGGSSIHITLPVNQREVSLHVLNMHYYEGKHPLVSMVLTKNN
jgi:predicted metal-dependent phosphoesterase TrpH